MPYFPKVQFPSQKSESCKVSLVGKKTEQDFRTRQFQPHLSTGRPSTFSLKKVDRNSQNARKIRENVESKQPRKSLRQLLNIMLRNATPCCVEAFINSNEFEADEGGGGKKNERLRSYWSKL